MTEQDSTRVDQNETEPPKWIVVKEMLYALKLPAFLTVIVFGLFTIPYSVGFAIDYFADIEYLFAGGDVYANRSIIGFTILGLIGVSASTVVAWYSGAKDRAKEKMDD